MTNRVQLRDVTEADLAVFFEHQQDPAAVHMAAFTAKDPADKAAFLSHWQWILSDDTITNKTILVDGRVAGHIGSFIQFGHLEITYWLGREYWGQGIATEALTAFLEIQKTRPIYGGAAKDNLASIRVMEKCGFTLISQSKGYANARRQEIEEVTLELKG